MSRQCYVVSTFGRASRGFNTCHYVMELLGICTWCRRKWTNWVTCTETVPTRTKLASDIMCRCSQNVAIYRYPTTAHTHWPRQANKPLYSYQHR
eukprot:scaffold472383_cov23-Prasinocladus_malaysianus.AAC.1